MICAPAVLIHSIIAFHFDPETTLSVRLRVLRTTIADGSCWAGHTGKAEKPVGAPETRLAFAIGHLNAQRALLFLSIGGAFDTMICPTLGLEKVSKEILARYALFRAIFIGRPSSSCSTVGANGADLAVASRFVVVETGLTRFAPGGPMFPSCP
jgi:hypothetical protein